MPFAFLLNPGKRTRRRAKTRKVVKRKSRKRSEAAKKAWAKRKRAASTKKTRKNVGKRVRKATPKRRKVMAKRKRRKTTRRNKSTKRSRAAKKGWRRRKASKTRRNKPRKRRVSRRRKARRNPRRKKYAKRRRKYTRRNKPRRRKYAKRKRKYTRRNKPRRRARRRRRSSYSRNPVATMKAVIKKTITGDTLKHIVLLGLGMVGAIVGEAVVTQKFLKTSEGAKIAGNIGGSLLTGAVIGLATKKVATGVKVATGGIAYTVFKLFYNKVLADRPIAGLILPPALGDWVSIPQTGMGSYVEIPSGMGQFGYEEAEGPPFVSQSMIGYDEEDIDY